MVFFYSILVPSVSAWKSQNYCAWNNYCEVQKQLSDSAASSLSNCCRQNYEKTKTKQWNAHRRRRLTNSSLNEMDLAKAEHYQRSTTPSWTAAGQPKCKALCCATLVKQSLRKGLLHINKWGQTKLLLPLFFRLLHLSCLRLMLGGYFTAKLSFNTSETRTTQPNSCRTASAICTKHGAPGGCERSTLKGQSLRSGFL